MNYCMDWYCLAVDWVGGLFEMTGPYGIFGAIALFIWILIK